MIKKNVLLVLILVSIVGIFGPVAQVNATSYDDCIAQALNKYNGNMQSALDECNEVAYNQETASCRYLDGLGNIICQIQLILNKIIPVLITLGVVYFVWGVVHYLIAGGDEAKKKGRDQIIYGIIGLAV